MPTIQLPSARVRELVDADFSWSRLSPMCRASPWRVLRVDASRVELDYDGVPTWVTVSGSLDLQVGEHVVVYAGQSLEKMDSAVAAR